MADTYSIYIVNQSSDEQLFWCFLAPPMELENDPGVYANSSASLAVVPNSGGSNYFAIPVQYIVGAGASNKAVGLGVRIVSNFDEDASLTQTWDANYATWPPNKGPTLSLSGTKAPQKAIAIVSNAFNKVTNETNGWFSNQSFGIQTESGFIGMSWSPNPQQTRTLTPKLTFYVATGNYGSNALASWHDVSNDSAVINVDTSFQYNKCTVTYTQTGGWNVTKGEPLALALADDLNWFLSNAHGELVALAYLSKGLIQEDKLEAVSWDTTISKIDGQTILTGTISITTVLIGAFTYFIISSVRIDLVADSTGKKTFRIRYDGTLGARAVQDLFRVGAPLLFAGLPGKLLPAAESNLESRIIRAR